MMVKRFSELFGVTRDNANIPAIAAAACREGYAVLPVHPNSKKPMCTLTPTMRKREDKRLSEAAKAAGHRGWMNVRHSNSGECGVHHAITDPAKARSIFARLLAEHSDLNIALEVGRSRMLCVDADNAADVERFTALWARESRFAALAYVRPTVSSPGVKRDGDTWVHKNGGHFWFDLPEGIDFSEAATATGLNLDGAQVYFKDRVLLVPPSVREEGPYTLHSDIGPAPQWLIDMVVMHVDGHAERRKMQRDRAHRSDDPIDAWAADTPWASLLEPDGWTAAHKFDNCGCEIWTRPGEWSSPKSATAHEPGCTAWDTEGGNGFLHLWTDSPPDFLAAYVQATGSKSLSELQYVAWRDHGGDYTEAMIALGLIDWFDGLLSPDERPPADWNPLYPFVVGAANVQPPQGEDVSDATSAGEESSAAAPETRDDDESLTGLIDEDGDEDGDEDEPEAPAAVHESPAFRAYVELEKEKLRARRLAQREVDEEEHTSTLIMPESTLTLADELDLPDEEINYTITDLLGLGGNALLAAQYKAGKTTMLGNLMRSLVDGEPFLGRFGVRELTGRVALLNYELPRHQARKWLRDMGFAHPERAAVLNLRGFPLPLNTEAGQAMLVKWLQDREVEVLLADPFGRAAAGQADENDNTEVRVWVDALDVIKRRAGVSDLVLSAHFGRSEERVRGATVLNDWADVNWLMTKDKDHDRFFSADGRDVYVEEVKLVFDPDTRRLTAVDGSRKSAETKTVTDLILIYLDEHPGALGDEIDNAVRDSAGVARNMVRRARKEAIEKSLIAVNVDPQSRAQRHYRFDYDEHI